MPTEYGSANVAPLGAVACGVYGLNLQAKNRILDTGWATEATNFTFDVEGRLASRPAWSLNSSISGQVARSMFIAEAPGESAEIVVGAGTHIYAISDPLTVSPTVTSVYSTATAGNWKFVNWNGNQVVGLQAGHPLIHSTFPISSFTAVTAASGTVPDGNELLSAFGRLWASDSTGQVLKYCNLLDNTAWTGTGAGEFNLTSIWADGVDSIVALASFNNYLIVFGSKNIIVWSDNTGSKLGMDPINMTVNDIIPGIGCLARDSVQNVNGDDLVFLSDSGVQSLKRVIIERSNAVNNLSKNVRDDLMRAVNGENPDNIKSMYSASQGIYLLSLPTAQAVYCFDTKQTLQDNTWRVTKWDNAFPTALAASTSFSLTKYFATVTGAPVSTTGDTSVLVNSDVPGSDNGAAYTCSYAGPWMSLGEDLETRLKMLKRVSHITNIQGSLNLFTKWAFDFQDSFTTYTTVLDATGGNALWGVGLWGISLYGPATGVFETNIPASGTGQYIKIGFSTQVDTASIALVQYRLYTKLGRLT